MITPEQLEQYHEQGFLVLRGFLEGPELAMAQAELDRMIDGAPVERDASVDRQGRPVNFAKGYAFTDLDDGRQVLNRISSQLAKSQVMRQMYGNPNLLSLAEALYGHDFVPFAESIVVKLPENGAPFAWHQDGPFKTGEVPERGVNFGIYLYPSDESNGCLHVIPASHRRGRVDIPSLVEQHGDRLPGSIPVPVRAGDMIVHSRNLVHGSFRNESSALRVTVYFGFHALSTVNEVYSTQQIQMRMAAVQLAIREREQCGLFPDEKPFHYTAPNQLDLDDLDLNDVLNAIPLTV